MYCLKLASFFIGFLLFSYCVAMTESIMKNTILNRMDLTASSAQLIKSKLDSIGNNVTLGNPNACKILFCGDRTKTVMHYNPKPSQSFVNDPVSCESSLFILNPDSILCVYNLRTHWHWYINMTKVAVSLLSENGYDFMEVTGSSGCFVRGNEIFLKEKEIIQSVAQDDLSTKDHLWEIIRDMKCFPLLQEYKNADFFNPITLVTCNTKTIKAATGSVLTYNTRSQSQIPLDMIYDVPMVNKSCVNQNCSLVTVGLTQLSTKLENKESIMKPLNYRLTNNPRNFDNYCCYLSKDDLKNRLCIKHTDFTPDKAYFSGYESTMRDFRIANMKDCMTGSCTGTEDFCSNFGCTGESKNYCKLDRETTELSVEHNGKIYRTNEIRNVEKEIQVFKNIPELHKKSDCKFCKFNCTAGILYAESRMSKFLGLKLCSKYFCFFNHHLNSNKIELTLPLSMTQYKTNLSLYYKIDNDNIYSKVSINCYEESICAIESLSYLNGAKWANVHCLLVWQWLLIILVLSISTIVIIGLAKVLFTIFYYIYLLTYPLFKWTWLQMKYFGAWIKYKTVKFYYQTKRPELYEYKTMVEKIKFIKAEPEPFDYNKLLRQARNSKISYKKSSRIFNPTMPIVILSLLGLLGMVDSCDVTTTLVVQQEQCSVKESGEKICSLTTSARIAVSPVGQTSCFILTLSGKPVGSAMIKTKSIRLACKKNSLYWVPHLRHDCSSSYNCHSAGWCSTDYKECNNPSSYTDKIFGNQNGYKFWHTCSHQPAGSECFYNSASCLHVLKRLLIKSTESMEVMDCSSWIYMVDVDIDLVKTTVDKTVSKSLLAGVTEFWENMKITLISVSVPPSVLFNKCFIKSGKLWSISECNRRGEYSIGRIGEIQCPNKISAETNKLGACIAEDKLIDVINKNEFVTCQAKYLDYPSYFKETLPMQFGSELIQLDQNTNLPTISITSDSLMEIQVDFQNYNVISKTDENYCYVKFISLKGCYSCSTGSTLSIEVNTNFGSATGSIKCPSIAYTTIVSVNQDINEKNLTLMSTSSKIESDCTIECPAGVKEFHISGILEYIPPDNKHSNDTTSGSEINNGSIDWGSLLKNPFSLGLFGIFLTIIVVGIILFISFKVASKVKVL